MEKLTMCRICLVEDVSMYEVANKDLQDMYEKLTDIPFVTEDCRPMLACFFCYTKLKQCCLFQRKCLKAEEVFTQMFNGDYEQIPLEFQGEIKFYGGFIRTSMEHMSIDDDFQNEGSTIREQLSTECDIKCEIELKEEYLSDEVEADYPENSCVDREDIPAHHSEPDSEDDVPLVKFKIEVKEEVPEESTRAPAAKKPKLEDTQKKNGRSDSKIIIHTTRNKTYKSVTKFRESIISDTIAKLKVNNSKEMTEESLNRENVKDSINTAINTNYRNNIKQDHFGCKIFNHKGISGNDIIMHKKICKPYTCDICQRSFNYPSYLNKHIRIHTGEKPYKCKICQRCFQNTSNLNRHIRTHTDEKPYKCDMCRRCFNNQYYLNKHRRIHTGEKTYKCNICQRSFRRKDCLKLHIRSHTGEKPYKCDICQRSFRRKECLKLHILSHTGEKPYKCNICQHSFITKSNLNYHIRTHTGEKPYKCDVCQRSFVKKYYLKSHIRKHTGEELYKCEICKRSFKEQSYLKKHILIHTGEKPYKCEICQRSFNAKGNLNRHIRNHTGEKPYKCEICHLSFTQKCSLKSHIGKHTRE